MSVCISLDQNSSAFKFFFSLCAPLFFLAACGQAEDNRNSPTPFGSDDGSFGGKTSEKNSNTAIANLATLYIPGNYPSLASALAGEEVGQLRRNQNLEIKIENGHQIEKNIYLRGGDYSNIKITCDTTISLSNDFPAEKDLFYGTEQVRLPIIDCLFDMRERGRRGLVITQASSAVLKEGAGFMNSPGHAIHISGASRFYGIEAKLLGSLESGFVVQDASMATCRKCDVSNAKDYGFLAQNASQLSIAEAMANNTGLSAIYAKAASSIHAEGAFAENAGGHGAVAVNVSRLNFNGGLANKAKEHAIYALRGSSISAYLAQANESEKIGIFAQSASTISADEAMANNAGATAIHATRASLIDAEGAVANEAGGHGALAQNVSLLNFNAKNMGNGNFVGGIANEASANGIYALRGSSISAYKAEANSAGQYGIVSRSASTVSADEAMANAQTNDTTISNVYATQTSLLNFYMGQAEGTQGGSEALVTRGGLMGLHDTSDITTNIDPNELSSSGIVLR